MDAYGLPFYQALGDLAHYLSEKASILNKQQQAIEERYMESQKGRGRGFAGMEPEERRRIASLGRKSAHRQGVAHQFTSEEAQTAGRKGGKVSRKGKRT